MSFLSPSPPLVAATVRVIHSSESLTLRELLQQSGSYGIMAILLSAALAIVGVVLLIARPRSHARAAYAVAAIAPSLVGLAGSVASSIAAFRAIGIEPSMFHVYAAIAEVSQALILGLFGSAVLMSLATLVWLMPGRVKTAPPPL